MTAVTFDDLTAAVDGSVILRDISLDIGDGEFVGVIGPSGSGKTTLLRTIAGFTDVVAGRLRFGGSDVTKVKTAERDIGMVVQQVVLFPSKTVQRNMAFPLELRHKAAEEIRHRVDAEARAMHLEHLLGRNPDELSRGEAQLVQIARAMVRTPRVLLLDEPFAGLDTARQGQIRSELSMLQAGYGVTTLMATNDPVDAMSMPHRLVVIDDGRVVQVGTPPEVWRAPATIDAALSTGDCRLLTARVSADTEGFWLTVARRGGRPGDSPALRRRAWHADFDGHVGSDITVGIRPTDLVVSSTGSVRATIDRRIAGSPDTVLCDVGGWRLLAQCQPGRDRGSGDVGDVIALRIDRILAFDATSGRAIAAPTN